MEPAHPRAAGYVSKASDATTDLTTATAKPGTTGSAASERSAPPAARKGQIREGIRFTLLIPLLQPQLSAEQGQQLPVLYQRFKRNEISKEDFIRGARVIAGDDILGQTIWKLYRKAQLEAQEREPQKQRELQQQQQQAQPSDPQPTKPQQRLPPNAAAASTEQPKEPNLQPQTTQPPSQTQEPTPAQLKPSAGKPGDRQGHDPGQVQPSNTMTAVPMLRQQVKHEVGMSLAKQQSPSLLLPQPRPPAMLQSPVVLGLPQQAPLRSQPSGHGHLHQSLPITRAPGHVVPQPQPLPQPQSQQKPQSQPAQTPTPQVQRPPKKPLTRYQFIKELTKREMLKSARKRKKAEEQSLKKVMEEENLRKLHSTPSGTVIAAHPGLHPQLSTPPVDLNKQAYGHHPGSLSHQAHMQAPGSQVDKQQQPAAPIAPGGMVPAGQGGLPLIPVKQEPSELQSEQKRQSFQLPKTLDLLPGQAAQKAVGQAQLSDASVLPTSQVQQAEGSNAEQVPGSMLLPSPSTATSLGPQAELASLAATSMVPIPPHAGPPGLQSTVTMKQVGGQQRLGSVPPAGPAAAAFNASALHPAGALNPAAPATSGQSSQAGATVSAAPAAKTPSKIGAVGQKKAAESAPAQQPASKKQKVSAGEPDQRIDQRNDVTAVSGVNLKVFPNGSTLGPILCVHSRVLEVARETPPKTKKELDELLRYCCIARAWYSAGVAVKIWKISYDLRRKFENEKRECDKWLLWDRFDRFEYHKLIDLLLQTERTLRNPADCTPMISE